MLIGLSGYARVGKDSICQSLGFKRAGFADSLKRICSPILAELGLDLGDPKQKEIARPILVAVGASARRKDPDFWVRNIELPKHSNVCVTDVRYVNEVRFIQSLGGVVFRVHRPGYGPANGEETRSFAEIESSMTLPVIMNDGSIEDAARRVLDWMKH